MIFRQALWTLALGNRSLIENYSKYGSDIVQKVVCSKHFDEDDYVEPGSKCLKPNILPKLRNYVIYLVKIDSDDESKENTSKAKEDQTDEKIDDHSEYKQEAADDRMEEDIGYEKEENTIEIIELDADVDEQMEKGFVDGGDVYTEIACDMDADNQIEDYTEKECVGYFENETDENTENSVEGFSNDDEQMEQDSNDELVEYIGSETEEDGSDGMEEDTDYEAVEHSNYIVEVFVNNETNSDEGSVNKFAEYETDEYTDSETNEDTDNETDDENTYIDTDEDIQNSTEEDNDNETGEYSSEEIDEETDYEEIFQK